MRRFFKTLPLIAAVLFAAAVSAQSARDLSFEGYDHRKEGQDQVFVLRVRNTSAMPVRVRGRFLAINVYDTSLPRTTIITDLVINAGETREISTHWPDAPSFGRIRGLLILTDGNAYLSEAFDVWIIPYVPIAIAGGVLLLIVVLVIIKVRMSGRHLRFKQAQEMMAAPALKMTSPSRPAPVAKETPAVKPLPAPAVKPPKFPRVPGNMIGHIVEDGDTVVSLSNVYGTTWQDIVKANRLRPPYPLTPGTQILIPKHELRRPPAPEPPRAA